mgnify:CR=1 FL=1
MKNLAQAIIKVMQDVKGIEKGMTVGSGSYSYKGVSDKDVKTIIGGSMAKHGLCILPIDVDAKTTIERWVEEYQGNKKQKQLIFSEVTTKYLLLHESGESQEVCGYGHGTDAMDKAAGKATTYSLKYLLLYLFLTPTGDIDDTDKEHSNNIQTPSAPTEEKDDKAWLNVGSKEWDGALSKGSSLTDLRKYFKISKANAEQYEQALKGK